MQDDSDEAIKLFLEMSEASSGLFSMFQSMKAAGFSDHQAGYILGTMLAEIMRDTSV